MTTRWDSYLPLNCPECGRTRLEWEETVEANPADETSTGNIRCEKCQFGFKLVVLPGWQNFEEEIDESEGARL